MQKKRLLIVAYHFPPLQGSSGLHRSLSMARYLPKSGWDVSVLTVSPKVYRKIHPDNEQLIPDGTRVLRAPAFDVSRAFKFLGWYPGFMAVPDNFQSWIASGAIIGLRHCRRFRPDVILSTFPVASAHYIAWLLQRWTNTPWVVDFRDPMAQDDYPADARKRRLFHRLEKRFIAAARMVTVTTPGTHRQYLSRYAELTENNTRIVPNGYDESMFAGQTAPESAGDGKITILHSGNIYKSERDPSQFFAALAMLREEDPQSVDRLRVLFRGAQQRPYYESMVADYGIESIVSFGDAVTYQEATREMLGADGLLILQASNCNEQIPAKIYEYLRSGRPIIACTDARGDTAALLRNCGIASVADLTDSRAIASCLRRFLDGNRREFHADDRFDISTYSRESIAGHLDSLLTGIAASGSQR